MENQSELMTIIMETYRPGDEIDLEKLAKTLPPKMVNMGPIISLKQFTQNKLYELVAQGKIIKSDKTYRLPKDFSSPANPDPYFLSRHE